MTNIISSLQSLTTALMITVLNPGVNHFQMQTVMNRADLYEVINDYRASTGKQLFNVDSRLEASAESKAQDMITNKYWAHDKNGDESTAWQLMRDSGYEVINAGENLAVDFKTPKDALNGWLKSPAHKANLDETRFDDMGIAVICTTKYMKPIEECLVVLHLGKD